MLGKCNGIFWCIKVHFQTKEIPKKRIYLYFSFICTSDIFNVLKYFGNQSYLKKKFFHFDCIFVGAYMYIQKRKDDRLEIF